MKKYLLTILFSLLFINPALFAITPDSSGQLQKKVKVSSNDSTSGFLNGKLVAGGNITFTENNDGGDETLTLAATGSLGYATVQDEGTSLTQRATTNFIGAGVTCTDNVGSLRTDCTIPGTSTFTVKKDDVNVSTVITKLDFLGADFDVTESPSGEANLSLASGVTKNTAIQTLTNKTLTLPIISSISNGGTVTIPTGADTLANLASTQTLTNKTIDGKEMGAATTRPAGSDIIQARTHATDCTTVTDGKVGEVCYEKDDNKYFICEPIVGDCDGASEWIQVNAPAGYTTVKDEGVALTARTNLNFIGSSVSCVDNNPNTDCTVTAGSATITVQEDDVTKDAAVTFLDFDTHFTVTSSPAGEANVVIRSNGLDFTEFKNTMAVDSATQLTTTDALFMKFSDAGGTNYSRFGTNGALTYGGAGKPFRTIDLTPTAGLSPATNGATKANIDGTNFSYPQASFSGAASDVNSLFWTFYKMPDSYDNAATIQCTVAWKTTSVTTTNGVVWQLASSGRSSAILFDTALGAFATTTSNPTATANQIIFSSPITLTTNFTKGQYVIFQLKRDAAHASDTETAAAVFLGMACEWAADAESDN